MDETPNTIKVDGIITKCLSLIDDRGLERAHLSAGTKDDDFVVFHLNDTQGRPRVTIQLDSSGDPQVMLFNANSAPAICLSLLGEKGNGIQIGRPGDGVPQIMLSVPGKDGHAEFGEEPCISISNSQGQELVIGVNG